MNGRIFGGSNSPAAPYHAYIEYKNSAGEGFYGGGSLVKANTVLTAAHIIHEMATWDIGLGATTIAALEKQKALSGHKHDEYDPSTRANDIGYLILTTPIETDPRYAIIALPRVTDHLPKENEQGTIVGFGWTDSERKEPALLQRSFQRVINDTECEKSFIVSAPLHFCARDAENSNVCYGDLGGGLVLEHRGERTLVGIASLTMVSCDATHPTGYTRVSAYRQWITEKLQI